MRRLLLLSFACLALVACGSSSSHSPAPATPSTTMPAAATTAAPGATPASAIDELAAAEHPRVAQFPAAGGKTLQQLAHDATAQAQLGPATGVFTPGTRRFAFALTDRAGAFVYAPTALYIATGPNAPASGPFLAPADPMTVLPQYRSRQNTGPGGIRAIYGTEVPLPHSGRFSLLALSASPKGTIGASGLLAVAKSSAIPDIGQRAPDIATDMLATVHGRVDLLTTRIPPERMHSVSFKDVFGKRPIALLISTPQLCTSRVCGPVTDVAVQLQREFGDRIVFIHQEVFVANQPRLGLRPQLKAFHLQTEPWLFTIDRHGVIRARLEGAFGLTEARIALEAALS
ncbi:MAG: hypothetical protein ACYDHH_20370 [Solirubrobacteraceae bacterium]